MVVRLTFFKFSQGKEDELKRIYREEIAPKVMQQVGNQECRLLEPLDKSEDFISMTVWDNLEDAERYHNSGIYDKLVSRVSFGFTKQPVLKVYQTESIMEIV